MISVEWENAEGFECNACGQSTHDGHVTRVYFEPEGSKVIQPDTSFRICSNCVADLIKRLS